MGIRSFIKRLENPRFASRVSSVVVGACWSIWAMTYFSGVEKSDEIQHDSNVEASASPKPSLSKPRATSQRPIKAVDATQPVQKCETDTPAAGSIVEPEAPSDTKSDMLYAEDKIKSLFETGCRACKSGNIVGAILMLSEMESISSSLPSANSRIDSKIKELRRRIARAEKKI